MGIGFAVEALAKRSEGYVPPPYSERVLCCIVSALPVAVFLSILTYLIFRKIDFEIATKRVIFFNLITLILIIVASLLAAMDAQNDELWYVSFWLALIVAFLPPIALFMLNSKGGTGLKIFLSVFLYFLLVVPLTMTIYFWQALGGRLGFDTLW
jgi:hypothetical protein